MKAIALLILFSFLVGCASYGDLNEKNGASVTGGFKDQALGKGLFFVEAASGFAPWANSGGSRATFDRRASELCGGRKYTLLWIYEETGTPTGFRSQKSTTVVGYILAGDSPLTIEEAKRVVNAAREKAGLYPLTDWKK
jgi:hypothetical protein